MEYAARSIGRGQAAGDNATTDRTVLIVTRDPAPVETRPTPDGFTAAAPPSKSGTGRFR